MSAGGTNRSRLRQALGLARQAALDVLAANPRRDAADLAVAATDALSDFVDRAELADLQRAGGHVIAALAGTLARGNIPPEELARVGAIIVEEACEVIDFEIKKLDAALSIEPDPAARRRLAAQRTDLRRERRRVHAALSAKMETGDA